MEIEETIGKLEEELQWALPDLRTYLQRLHDDSPDLFPVEETIALGWELVNSLQELQYLWRSETSEDTGGTLPEETQEQVSLSALGKEASRGSFLEDPPLEQAFLSLEEN